MRRKVLLVSVAALVIVMAALAFGVRQALLWRAPALATPKLLRVDEGESLRALATRLGDEGLIVSPTLFLGVARWRGVDRKVRSGVYELRGGATLGETVDLLVSGPQYTDQVAIPEGWTVDQIAARLELAGLGSAARFRELASNADFAASLGVPAERLEGYLFPDTYAFGEKDTPEEILARMTRRFQQVFDVEMVQAAERAGLTVHQAVTLASLVEKEAAVPEERAMISAVFHNRLARNMRLESDPTVLYGVVREEGPIRRSELERATPYNTYVIRGLPPGPIANPGRAALAAAVSPAPDGEVLYFVSRNDRTHEFNQTFSGHRRAVDRYQRRGGG